MPQFVELGDICGLISIFVSHAWSEQIKQVEELCFSWKTTAGGAIRVRQGNEMISMLPEASNRTQTIEWQFKCFQLSQSDSPLPVPGKDGRA